MMISNNHKQSFIFLMALIAVTLSGIPSMQPVQAQGPLPLSAYPRPKYDNGLGIHWSTSPYGQEDKVTDYFIAEIKAMDITWVKFLNDQTDGRHNDYLIEQLVANDIMPIMRIYLACNDPINLAALANLVQHYVPKGLYYYEIYNEPDIPGRDGGWCDDPEPDPEYLAGVWAPAAREIIAHGGYPSLPSIFPMGKNVPGWEDSFFQRFLRAIRANGDTPVLHRSWGAVHNYFINHPPDYPQDEVNLTGRPLTPAEIQRYQLDEHQVYAMNQARANQFEPGGYYVGDDPTLDVTHFRQFIAYHDQFVEIFGFEIPLISTEGGATVGSCEDPRYPCVDEQIQMEWTLAAHEYMQTEAPDYYFATSTWLIAQKALDHFGGTVWESNAWYHDRKGNYIPVVDALKRLKQQRLAPQNSNVNVANTSARSVQQPTNPLAYYPRPPNDNGRGIHYSPTILGQPPEMVDFFVAEMVAMNIKWVKLLQGDTPKVEHVYLIEQLVAHDIEPILRVYKPYNDPYEHLGTMVPLALRMGVHYFELYNEPNIAGFPGGWRDGEPISIDRILALWIPAAEAIQQAGGYPGLPALAPGGSYEDMQFLDTFLGKLQASGRTDLLNNAWLPLHNYFLNHPFDYPDDDVNQHGTLLTPAEIEKHGLWPEQIALINQARQANDFRVGQTIHEDSNSFRKFEAYAAIFQQRFGYHIPIITTEGGVIIGDNQDPRYPAVTSDHLTEVTLQAYHAMIDTAPAYYFAFTPWLLTNSAGGHWDPAWENAAWYKIDGSTLPVVDALKGDRRRYETRPDTLFSTPPAQVAQVAQAAAPLTPALDPLGIEIITVPGEGSPWQVPHAQWQPTTNRYPRLRVNVVDAAGRQMSGQQVRVQWATDWVVLITEPGRNVSLAISRPDEVYQIRIAGGGGEAVQARGKEGHNLVLTFQHK